MKFYVLAGTYNEPNPLTPAETEALMPGHKEFVQRGVEAGMVLFGGPRASGVSGMIVVRAEDENALMAYINTDPMVTNGVQHYEITEILPKEHQAYIEPWLN